MCKVVAIIALGFIILSNFSPVIISNGPVKHMGKIDTRVILNSNGSSVILNKDTAATAKHTMNILKHNTVSDTCDLGIYHQHFDNVTPLPLNNRKLTKDDTIRVVGWRINDDFSREQVYSDGKYMGSIEYDGCKYIVTSNTVQSGMSGGAAYSKEGRLVGIIMGIAYNTEFQGFWEVNPITLIVPVNQLHEFNIKVEGLMAVQKPSIQGEFEDMYGELANIPTRWKWYPHPLTGQPTMDSGPFMGDFKYLKLGVTYIFEMSFGDHSFIKSSYTFKGTELDASFKVDLGDGNVITENYTDIFQKHGGLFWKDFDGSVKNTPESVYPWYYRTGNHSNNPQSIGTFLRVLDNQGEWWLITPLTIQRESEGTVIYEQMHDWMDGRIYYYYNKLVAEYNEIKETV